MRRFELYFYGYTWEEYAFQISSLKGIFLIYQGCLDSEGSIDIKNLLYVGYHNGIIDLYENGVIGSLKQYVDPGNRLFLSYAEVPTNENGEELASIINSVVKPKYIPNDDRSGFSNIQLVIKGNHELIPEEIII
jgi:hypothetical protein